MEHQHITEIIWAVEEKIMSRKVRNNPAVNAFRSANCLRDDFRLEEIIAFTFNRLIYYFNKEGGSIKLTNVLVKIGENASKVLKPEHTSIKLDIQLGNLIIDTMITQGYLILDNDIFYTFEKMITSDGVKTKRFGNYNLLIGTKMKGYDPIMLANTMDLQKFPTWTGLKRGDTPLIANISKEVTRIDADSSFVKAVNNLESVKWAINPKVAVISEQMIPETIDTMITIQTKAGDDVEFDVFDIFMTDTNLHLAKEELLFNGQIFNPKKGNQKQVEALDKDLKTLNSYINNLSPTGMKAKTAKAKYKRWLKKYDRIANDWTAKKYCLGEQSKVFRNTAILNTIHGADGWASYQFYSAMFMDFRGRMYARNPFFSYQSSDLARGHLMFAQKKLMTDKGYQHLLVHTANSFNQTYTVAELSKLDWMELNYIPDLDKDDIKTIDVDKMSIQDRKNWADENLTMFTEIVDDPMNNKIWLKADKPWVFLSLCYEIIAYWETLGNGEDYYSQIPIAIDGASNGTQHLAAISRDERAGRMVGLTPMSKPVDFYIEVAKGIIGDEVGTDIGKLLSKIPMKYIRKGITKRGTMTRAYDAGIRCIADIIYDDSYTAGLTVKYGITRNIAFLLAKALVKTYNTLCEGPVKVKEYLQQLVKFQITVNKESNVSWVTPTGFKVVSEKYYTKRHFVRIYLQDKQRKLIIQEQTDKPMVSDIMSGISPNYIHSMDASHMALVINELHELGITSFGAIHDSFSVHAEDVDQLYLATKYNFIDMYRDCTYKLMADHITNGTYNVKLDELFKGDLIIEDLINSDYFFC